MTRSGHTAAGKRQFKSLDYQTAAVQAVADCFKGQPYADKRSYRFDKGRERQGQTNLELESGFRNADIALSPERILQNLREAQRNCGIFPPAEKLSSENNVPNLDIEMETGTGKTYCYIKTAFELNRLYGWSKFIIIVPSIAIREGVYYTLRETAEHFMAAYGKKARFFTYDSARLAELESFSSDSGLNIMIVNMQAFNARGKDNRRIYEELDDFQSRKPIDVLAANRPILIIDEPQKQEGPATREALPKFKPLMILRYSATHKTKRDCVYRLDAVDAYNKKLVKKIAVRGMEISNAGGARAYLYLEGIDVSAAAPKARLGFERRLQTGRIRRAVRKCGKGADIFALSGELEAYKQGFTLSEIDANKGIVEFTNGLVLKISEAKGDITEEVLRQMQIRSAIRAHLEKERALFGQNIKVLSLFFIDEVKKYRDYEREDKKGDYARLFEEEYEAVKADFISESLPEIEYRDFLRRDSAEQIHGGYFSIDKKGHMTDPALKRQDEGISKDTAAYDLILKDKDRLLSRAEPVRFIFSHSALREGWDNPNIFTLCMLKNSNNDMSRRQEVGRGLRLCVNDKGERQDAAAIVHDINVLTVIANESYHDFTAGLQREYAETLNPQARRLTADFFTGRIIETAAGEKMKLSEDQAKDIARWLIKNDYTDKNDSLNDVYFAAAKAGELAALPEALKLMQAGIFALLNQAANNKVEIENSADKQEARLNEANFAKLEFQELWRKINRKAVYRVDYDTETLIADSIRALNENLRVEQLFYTERRGALEVIDKNNAGLSFSNEQSKAEKISFRAGSGVKYDLLDKIGRQARLTRRTAAKILAGIDGNIFAQFADNPEAFIAQAARLILAAKIKLVVERLRINQKAGLAYYPLQTRYEASIFAASVPFYERRFVAPTPRKHIYDKALLDSAVEMDFAGELEGAAEVVVYAKLPHGFFIPTPVGNYNPDWAIAFDKGKVRHIYFIAETKGSGNKMDLRPLEAEKIQCAERYFSSLGDEEKAVRYKVIRDYAELRSALGLTNAAA